MFRLYFLTLLCFHTLCLSLFVRNDKLATELREARDRLVADCNRDQYIQKLVNEYERQLKDEKERSGQLQVENKALTERLNQEVRN